ncbi:hypothetical protein MPTK1_6g18700 [Marchantia polymorpha subsp. ruderalis]|uniref:Uncharacterized protein n=2 Tax=Marchantia polymorpha TaxID=3197 RepID=A0AAF6BTI9_MARPO|nr:hypothetical protein MARPO_0038s0080 [Marchantia polymorpha]BBN15323.1 hypothetical protein Mp_6g18700 [Marchantia polymorpha subsp. ruderalis]|eukprot:PTQ40756.1 hypothetical protein MARPO_0038s0080 [Marchantia polymorpha]
MFQSWTRPSSSFTSNCVFFTGDDMPNESRRGESLLLLDLREESSLLANQIMNLVRSRANDSVNIGAKVKAGSDSTLAQDTRLCIYLLLTQWAQTEKERCRCSALRADPH